MQDELSKKTEKTIIISIVILAAVLRFWGIWHGYPYSYYPDEAHFVKRALAFGSGDLNPHWFHKPAFYMYLLFFEYGLFFVFGKIAGFWNGVNDFAIFYIKNPGPFYLIGRITTSMFSLGSIIFTYLIANKLFNRKTGLMAALMLSLAFGHVLVAKDVKADTACAFFTIVSVYFLICYMHQRQTKHIILSSVFAGVGAATKYYSMVMFAPIFWALLLDVRFNDIKSIFDRFKTFIICILSFYLIFFICSPYNFLDPLGREWTFKEINYLAGKVHNVFTQSNKALTIEKHNVSDELYDSKTSITKFQKGIGSYIVELKKGMGFVILVVVLSGIIYAFWNLNWTLFMFLVFPILFVSISLFLRPGYSDIRHQIPIYPFLIICGAALFIKALDILTRFNRWQYLLLLVLVFPLYKIIKYDIYISRQDIRNIAKQWIESNIPAGTKILVEEGKIKISPGKKYYENLIEKAKNQKKSQFTVHSERQYSLLLKGLPEITYDLTSIRFPWWQKKEKNAGVYSANSDLDVDMGNPLKPVGVMPYQYYKQRNYKYVITTSDWYEYVMNRPEIARKFPSFYDFYTQLFKKGILIKEFNPDLEWTPGPVIKIFQIN